MATNGHPLNGWRTDPMYSFGEAAHLANVSPGTVRNWLLGYRTKDREAQPLFTSKPDQGPMVSFLQLIEVVVAGRLRKAEHAKYQTVAVAYRNAKDFYGYEYPFAHINVEAIGGHIVHWIRGTMPSDSLQALDLPQQWTLPGTFHEIHEELDYDDELAARWYPIGKSVPIVVDPLFGSGVPTILGRGVTVTAISKRFFDGRLSIEDISQDFELDPYLVQHALRFKELLTA